MAHIHTQPGQHDFTTSAYIIRLDTPEPSLVMHRHRILHQLLQFGGHVELNENPWASVMHEIREESGYDMSQLEILQPDDRLKTTTGAILHPVPITVLTFQFADTDHYHTDIPYAFITREEPANKPAEGESTEFRLVTADELVDLPKGDVPENVRDIGLYILRERLSSWTPIPPSTFAASLD
jgi:hypothetical protein